MMLSTVGRALGVGVAVSAALFASLPSLAGCGGASTPTETTGAGIGAPSTTKTPAASPSVPPGYEPPTTTTPVSCTAAAGSLYAITPKNLKGQETPLCQYAGKVLLVVNTASMCGYTPQLTPLQGLYDKYGPQGLTVLGFPSRSFNQEYDNGDDVSAFCTTEYHITFPLFDIANVNPPEQQPVYQWLNAQPGMSDAVGWNFEKFLIGKDGKIAKRFLTAVEPDAAEVTSAIEAELAK